MLFFKVIPGGQANSFFACLRYAVVQSEFKRLCHVQVAARGHPLHITGYVDFYTVNNAVISHALWRNVL